MSRDMRAAGRLDVGSALTRLLLARSGAYSVQRDYAAVVCGPVYATPGGWRGRKGEGEVGCSRQGEGFVQALWAQCAMRW